MLTNRRVDVKIGRTINTGNYESERIDISLGGDIGEKDSIEKSIEAIYNLLEEQIATRIGNKGIN